MALSLLKFVYASFSRPVWETARGYCIFNIDVSMTSWFSEGTNVQGSGLSSCPGRGCEHACLHASTPESNARQISPKFALLLTPKTCDRTVAQGLGKARLTNWQTIGFDCPALVQRWL